MESFINPYIYVGTSVRKEEIIDLVSTALRIPSKVVKSKNKLDILVDARSIILNEFKRKYPVKIESIKKLTGLTQDRSTLSIHYNSYDNRYKFNKDFRDNVERYKNYLKEINVNYETYKII